LRSAPNAKTGQERTNRHGADAKTNANMQCLCAAERFKF
jgi:hypothetical protein